MHYIKNNKMFMILLLSYTMLILFFSYLLFQGEDTQLPSWVSGNMITENTIEYFHGTFNEERHAVELNWDVQLANSGVKKFEIYQNNTLLREGMNATSALLSIEELALSTGNNKFDLKIYLKNDTVLEKSMYVYIDEVFGFEVSENVEGTSLMYTLEYCYDVNRPVTPPQMYIYNIDQPFAIEFVDATEETLENGYKKVTAKYELTYENVEPGSYKVEVAWEFIKYNLKFPKTNKVSSIEIW